MCGGTFGGILSALCFPGSSARKESTCNAGDPGSIPASGRPTEDSLPTPVFLGFPGGSDGKESACNAGDLGLIPGLGRSPGGGHGNPLQYSCLENPHGLYLARLLCPWVLSRQEYMSHKELDMTERSTGHSILSFCS